MNAPVVKPLAAPMVDMFEAWIAGDRDSRRVLSVDANDLAEVRIEAQSFCKHKDWLLIKQTYRRTGAATLHVYYVKQKAATWVRKPGFAHAVQVRPLEAELQFSIPVDAFSPVEPFRWEPGCDVVGGDRGTINA